MAVIRMKAKSWGGVLGIRKKIFGAGYSSAGFVCSATLYSRESAPTATNPSISAMVIDRGVLEGSFPRKNYAIAFGLQNH